MTYYLTQIRIANSRWNVFHLRVVKIITALVSGYKSNYCKNVSSAFITCTCIVLLLLGYAANFDQIVISLMTNRCSRDLNFIKESETLKSADCAKLFLK